MTDNKMFDWKKHLIECLNSTEFCCLATADEAGVWSNPVYFAWDDSLNLYFISQPGSRHMKSIAKDGRVAMSIYSSKQSAFDDVCGIQLAGRARILSDIDEIKHAYATYYGRKYPKTGRNESGKAADSYQNGDWLFVRVAPEQMFYFDTRFFDEARQEVPLGSIL